MYRRDTEKNRYVKSAMKTLEEARTQHSKLQAKYQKNFLQSIESCPNLVNVHYNTKRPRFMETTPTIIMEPDYMDLNRWVYSS